jgi:parvulin-like peptidyl-prolyl isomerase
VTLGLVTTLTACDTGSDRIVATAGDHELLVDQLVELLARQNAVPNQPEVVEALANFWVDYALLAQSAQEDSLFTDLDLSPILEPQFQQEIIDVYLRSTVEADTALSEEALRALWDADPPADSVRARHILLAFPSQATESQVDSVMTLAVELKNRATRGESFEALARRYSEDTGSGALGGDLGYFGPGAMVPTFEEATYALEVGEVSDPVGSQFGVHVIQLVDRKPTTFENGAVAFRNLVVTQRIRQADSTFLSTVDEEAEIEVTPEAVTVLRELAARPQEQLSGRAAGRTLVDYRGGAYTAGGLREFLQSRPVEFATQVQGASDDDLNVLLQRLGQARVLIARAEASGVTLSEERQDTLYRLTVDQVTQATDVLGIRQIRALENETADEALDRTLLQIIRELVAGTRSAIPLSVVTVALRRDEDWSISDRSIAATVARIAEVVGSAEETRPPIAPAPQPAPDEATPDTTGN